jgi:hypothetical protein
MSQCTAKSKRSGERCRAKAVRGRRTCRMHGGTTAVGPAAPAYKGKGYSDYLSARMLERYRAAEADGDLLALRRDLALVDARLVDVLSRVESGESGKLWRRLQEQATEAQHARRSGDEYAIKEALSEPLTTIRRGHLDYAAWADVINLLDIRKKLVESERKRLVQMQQMVTSEQVMALVEGLVESVRSHVRDERALGAIAADFARLLGRGDPDGADETPD